MSAPRAFLPAPARDLLLVLVAYVAALAAGVAAFRLTPGPELLRFFVADAVATVVVFVASRLGDNTSFYDPYWSVAPPALGFGALFVVPAGDPTRRWVMLGLVSVWAVRLTLNWMRGWDGLSHEDWRYRDYRPVWGRFYWVGSFFGLHFFPTVLTFVGSISLLEALPSTRPFGALDAVAAAVTLGATLLEHVADEQLRAFRRDPANQGKICDVGLWGRSRHPNYLGEIGFWVGLWLFSVASGAGSLWASLGPVLMIALFRLASIPLAERRSLKRRPGYAAHMKRVPALVPRPW